MSYIESINYTDFKNYLSTHTGNIRINHITKLKEDIKNINIKNFSLNDEMYIEGIKINGYDNCFYNSKENAYLFPKNNHKSINVDFYKLFLSFKSLGKILYKFNNNYTITIYKDYYVTQLFNNSLNQEEKEIILKWLNKYKYCVTLDKDTDSGFVIEINALVNIAIYTYLIFESINNYFKVKDAELNQDIKYNLSSKAITFDKYITFANKRKIKDDDYLFNIPKIIFSLEQSYKSLISEHSELIYNDDIQYYELTHTYENMYSLVFHILKLYIDFTFRKLMEEDERTKQCKCGKYITGRDKLCKNCKKAHNNKRRKLNRENEKVLKEINTLYNKNKLKFTKNIYEQIEYFNSHHSYKHNSKLKALLKELKNIINPAKF